jgi:hypothetical protein
MVLVLRYGHEVQLIYSNVIIVFCFLNAAGKNAARFPGHWRDIPNGACTAKGPRGSLFIDWRGLGDESTSNFCRKL